MEIDDLVNDIKNIRATRVVRARLLDIMDWDNTIQSVVPTIPSNLLIFIRELHDCISKKKGKIFFNEKSLIVIKRLNNTCRDFIEYLENTTVESENLNVRVITPIGKLKEVRSRGYLYEGFIGRVQSEIAQKRKSLSEAIQELIVLEKELKNDAERLRS